MNLSSSIRWPYFDGLPELMSIRAQSSMVDIPVCNFEQTSSGQGCLNMGLTSVREVTKAGNPAIGLPGQGAKFERMSSVLMPRACWFDLSSLR